MPTNFCTVGNYLGIREFTTEGLELFILGCSGRGRDETTVASMRLIKPCFEVQTELEPHGIHPLSKRVKLAGWLGLKIEQPISLKLTFPKVLFDQC